MSAHTTLTVTRSAAIARLFDHAEITNDKLEEMLDELGDEDFHNFRVVDDMYGPRDDDEMLPGLNAGWRTW